jgi:hypothetical protein
MEQTDEEQAMLAAENLGQDFLSVPTNYKSDGWRSNRDTQQ